MKKTPAEMRIQAAIDQADAFSEDTGRKHLVSETDLARLVILADIGNLYLAINKLNPPPLVKNAAIVKLRELSSRVVTILTNEGTTDGVFVTATTQQLIRRVTGLFNKAEGGEE